MLTTLLSIQLNIGAEAKSQQLVGSQLDFGGYLSLILAFVMTIAIILLFFYLVWGGIDWITAGGDQSKIQKARDKMTQGVIGLIVLASSVAIINIVQLFLGVSVLNFDQSFTTRINGIFNRARSSGISPTVIEQTIEQAPSSSGLDLGGRLSQ